MTITRTTPLDALPEFLTVPEVARYLGIPRTSAYMLVQRGTLRAVCLGTPCEQYPRGKIIRVPRAALTSLARTAEQSAGAK